MKSGFTLVELLVTVCILGILASLAIAEYGAYKARANDAIALGALKNLILAWEARPLSKFEYEDEHRTAPQINFTFENGVPACTSQTLNPPCDPSRIPELLPGYVHPSSDVTVRATFYHYINISNDYSWATASHCRGTPKSLDGVSGTKLFWHSGGKIVNNDHLPAYGSPVCL